METLAHMAASAEPATIECESCDAKFTSSQQYEMHLGEVHNKTLEKEEQPGGAKPENEEGGDASAGADTEAAAAKLQAMREEQEQAAAPEGQAESTQAVVAVAEQQLVPAETAQTQPAQLPQQPPQPTQEPVAPATATPAAPAPIVTQAFPAPIAGQAPRPRAPLTAAGPARFYSPAQLPPGPGPRPPFLPRPPMAGAPPPTSLPMVAPRNSTPGTVVGGVKRTLSGADEGEVDSEEDKKRRNRAAAQRCRLKKKKQIAELEGRSVQLQRDNQELRAQQQRLIEELGQLKALINEHKRTCTVPFPQMPAQHPAIPITPNPKPDPQAGIAPAGTSPGQLLTIVPRKPSQQMA